MVKPKTQSKKKAEGAGKKDCDGPVATGSQARVVKKLLAKVEKKLSDQDVKATLGDYIRLVQLQKELDEDEPKEIKVTWNNSQFASAHGRPLSIITTNTVDPASYPDEVSYLPTVIGNFTDAVMAFVRTSQPACRFEVLYPTDVNQSAFNQAINYPTGSWTPAALTCLKTENFGFTLGRDLDQAVQTIHFGQAMGFTAVERSQLVGVGDSTTAWLKEAKFAMGRGFESVVLFALDQFCLIGYPVPLPESLRRSLRMGS